MALTLKQEDFCRSYTEHGNASEAYRVAYDAGRAKPETINRSAKALMDDPKIAARIAELRADAAKRNEITVDDLIAELEEARQVALSAETPQASAAISSTMGKAKLLGMDKQVVEHVGKNGAPLFSKIEVVIVNAPLRDSR